MPKKPKKLDRDQYFSSQEKRAAFEEWRPALAKELKDNSKDDLLWLLTYGVWRYEALVKQYDKLKEDLDYYKDTSMLNLVQGMQRANLAKRKLRANAENIRLGENAQQNLEKGRKQGTQKRMSSTIELHGQLTQAVADLFQHGEGWKMNNKAIATFLTKKGFDQHYTFGTLQRKIAPIAGAIRKAEKNKQA